MVLGQEKHREALSCVEDTLKQWMKGRYALEQRYRYLGQPGQVEPLSTQQVEQLLREGRWKELVGTLEPDVVIHTGDLKQVLWVYEFKFPCVALRPLPTGTPILQVTLTRVPIRARSTERRSMSPSFVLCQKGSSAMSKHYPKFRMYSPDGCLALKEGLVLTFFMKHSHGEMAHAIVRVLERYREAVGREKLALYFDIEGEWQLLDEPGWTHVHQELLGDPEAQNTWLHLVDRAFEVVDYALLYLGNNLDAPSNLDRPDLVSGLSLWLPTEELEARGPRWVRQLAIDVHGSYR
jgi:hypothetical protein